jgi:glycosyltransferase involved in cell wall biosynthesis
MNEEWINALAGVVREGVFVVAGEGPHEGEVRARVRAEGLEGRVKVLGHVDPLGVYQAADVLLLPSEREGFSLVCAEAMSCGVPVLRTRTAGTTETVVEGVTGRSVEIDREAFLSAAGEMMTMDAGMLRGMGEAAAKHVRERLTFERQYEATVELYRRISGRGVA